jgi:hypothetical protein
VVFDRIIFIDDDRCNIRDLEDADADTKAHISILHYVEHAK